MDPLEILTDLIDAVATSSTLDEAQAAAASAKDNLILKPPAFGGDCLGLSEHLAYCDRLRRTQHLLETLRKAGCTERQIAETITTLRQREPDRYESCDFTPDSSWSAR